MQKKNIVIIEITDEIYRAFDSFELEDISQMHKYDKYIEHSEVYDETLYKRMTVESIAIEDIVDNKIRNEKLFNAINQLNNSQKRRIIMYYFNGLKLNEIALIEGCSFQAINKSIKLAEKKLKYILKKNF